jgi:FAD synthetase
MQPLQPRLGEHDTPNGEPVIHGSTPESLLPDAQLPLHELCARIHERIEKFLAEDFEDEGLGRVQRQTRSSLEVIEKTLERYRLVLFAHWNGRGCWQCSASLPEISLSYNGGKDCLVLLILYLAALHKTYISNSSASANTQSTSPPTIQTVYIVSSHPFPEVEDFVTTSSKTCSLSLSRYAKGMKEAFTDYLHDFPTVKAIFVGTRRTDPHGEFLTHFDQTDHGWPAFMRVHPVIDWHYVDIWTVCLPTLFPL